MAIKKTVLASLLAAGLLSLAGQVHAAATIVNTSGTVALGVNDEGHLNTSTGNVAVNSGATGLSYKFPDGSFRDATSPGCLCEGWGVSVNGTTSGYANVDSDGGAVNLSVSSFSATANSATSVVTLTSLPGLKVTHAYSMADKAPSVFFKDVVTITNNTGAEVTDLKFVRVMDWDVPETEFNEYVTIKGVGTTTLLERSHNNGFNTANPLGGDASIDPATEDVDFTDAGPKDQGAYFRFNFGSLADGESYTFTTFYGAAGSESAALAAIGAEGIELYSLGQSNGGQRTGEPATFIFGFSGVGGTPVEPPNGVPEPGSLALLGVALAGLAASRRRRAN